MFEMFRSRAGRSSAPAAVIVLFLSASASLSAMQPVPETATAQAPRHAGGEANLVLPDLSAVEFQGINGRTLLMSGLLVCALGLAFGMTIFTQLRNLPVHRSMREISELIYETCKTYLITQGKFILILWVFIGIITGVYFGWLAASVDPATGAVVHGFPIALDKGDSLGLSLFGSFEPEQTALVETLVKPGDTVVDLGAHIGYYTLLFAKLVGPSGHVVAFEPSPASCAILRRNVASNGLANVTIVNAAVGAASRSAVLRLSANPLDHHVTDATGGEVVPIEVVALGASGVDASAGLDSKTWGTEMVLSGGFAPGQQFFVWLERADGSRVPAGSFTGIRSDSIEVTLASSLPTAQAVAVGITNGEGEDLVRTELA